MSSRQQLLKHYSTKPNRIILLNWFYSARLNPPSNHNKVSILLINDQWLYKSMRFLICVHYYPSQANVVYAIATLIVAFLMQNDNLILQKLSLRVYPNILFPEFWRLRHVIETSKVTKVKPRLRCLIQSARDVNRTRPGTGASWQEPHPQHPESGGRDQWQDDKLARARDHRDHQEPVSRPMEASAPHRTIS